MMMHNYNTIIGVIGLRNNKVSYPTIRQRYGIGNSGIDLIMNRYKESGLSWEDFLKLEPSHEYSGLGVRAVRWLGNRLAII